MLEACRRTLESYSRVLEACRRPLEASRWMLEANRRTLEFYRCYILSSPRPLEYSWRSLEVCRRLLEAWRRTLEGNKTVLMGCGWGCYRNSSNSHDVGAGLAPARRSRRLNDSVQRWAGASPAPTSLYRPPTARVARPGSFYSPESQRVRASCVIDAYAPF